MERYDPGRRPPPRRRTNALASFLSGPAEEKIEGYEVMGRGHGQTVTTFVKCGIDTRDVWSELSACDPLVRTLKILIRSRALARLSCFLCPENSTDWQGSLVSGRRRHMKRICWIVLSTVLSAGCSPMGERRRRFWCPF